MLLKNIHLMLKGRLGTLSVGNTIDTEAFRKADVDTVKNLFGNSRYFGKSVASSAQRMESFVCIREIVHKAG